MAESIWGAVGGSCLLGLFACGAPASVCPRPSIVGVPPESADRVQSALPLSTEGRSQLTFLFTGCDDSGASICKKKPSAVQACVLTKLAAALPNDSKAAALAVASCGDFKVALEVNDARGDGQHPVRGAAVAGYVFAFYPGGLPPAYDGKSSVVVFPDYVPTPTP